MKTLRVLVLSLLVSFTFATPLGAQTPITANGQMCESDGGCFPFSLTFDPKGGPVTGKFSASSGSTSLSTTFSGTFAGGNGGTASGKITGQGTKTSATGTETTAISGSWSGVFRANGTGEGKWNWTADYATSGTWSVTYSATAFRTALGTGVMPPSPTPGVWDLAIQKIVPLQAIEGAKFVTGKAAAVRVFVTWSDPATIVDATVELQMNGASVGRITQKVKNKFSASEVASLKNSFNFFIPAERIQSGNNTFSARVTLGPLRVGQEQMKDPNAANNEKSASVMAYNTRSLSVLVVSTNPKVGTAEVSNFLAEAYPYINNVYPLRVSIPPYFYRSEHLYFDTAMHNVIALEAARQLYTSQTGKVASYAVGLYPPNYYGADTHGMSFWWNRRAVLVEANNPESMPHEIGHGLGGKDEYSSSEPGKYLPQVNIYRANAGSLEDLSALGANQYINFMGNAGKSPATWVSAEMWNLLVDGFKLGTGAHPVNGLSQTLAQESEDTVEGFLVTGLIDKNDAIQVEPPLWLPRLSPYPTDQTSDYTLSLSDAKGNELKRVPLYLDLTASNPAPFIAVIPASQDQSTLTLRHGSKVLSKWSRSANAPQVKLNAPALANNQVVLTWQASDADKDSLTHTVLLSYDGGQTWLTAATALKEPRLELSTATMPGCTPCLVRILTTDGWHTTVTNSSATFNLENKAPAISIATPKDGASLTLNSPLIFSAAAYDAEDGLLEGANVIWRSDKNGELGQGQSVMVTALSAGTHTITVTAKDKNGATTQKAIKITIAQGEATIIPAPTLIPTATVMPSATVHPTATPQLATAAPLLATPTTPPNDNFTQAIFNSLLAAGIVFMCGSTLLILGAIAWVIRQR